MGTLKISYYLLGSQAKTILFVFSYLFSNKYILRRCFIVIVCDVNGLFFPGEMYSIKYPSLPTPLHMSSIYSFC